MLFEALRQNTCTAGGLDGWRGGGEGRGKGRELKALPQASFDTLARLLTVVEEIGVWPEKLLDGYMCLIRYMRSSQNLRCHEEGHGGVREIRAWRSVEGAI